MNSFQKKSLCVALATAGALGAGAAQAVSVSPDGLGQVLIYPYYTTQATLSAPWNSLLSVVNTTNSTKAVKVRFREGKASAEVLDFNVFLSPQDVWTAAIVPDVAVWPPIAGAVVGAKVVTSDNSCTIPSNLTLKAGVPFRDLAYKNDPIGGTLERTREGYVEIIEMAQYVPTSVVAINSKHGTAGIPADCSKVTDSVAASEAQAPGGGLSGGITLVNVLLGMDASVDATALANWRNAAIYSTTGSESPALGDALPTTSLSTNASGNTVYATWANGDQAVSAPLMKSAVINEFVLDANTLSTTDWVVTFPTKHLFVDSTVALPPFQNKLGKTGACDAVAITDFNREEAKRTVGGPDFSPSPTPEGTSICWEANILSINGKSPLGSANSYTIATLFTNGWMNMQFGSAAGVSPVWVPTMTATAATAFVNGAASAASTTFTGLPVLGFAVQTFTNGTLTDASNRLIQSTYAGVFGHKYQAAQ
jgi:hypothetical protein